MKNLPSDIVDFKKLREGNYIYVDKTDILHYLVNEDNFCFLSRPSGFGKTLLMSTLNYLLSGEKSLFDGLQIENTAYEFKKEAVVSLQLELNDSHNLEEKLVQKIVDLGKVHEIFVSESKTRTAFSALIKSLCQKYGQKVSVLIDDYDAPVRYQLQKADEQLKNIEILNSFYSQILELKNDFIRFAFLIGENRVPSGASFNLIDHFKDISFMDKYALICGFSRNDLDGYFQHWYAPALEALASKRNDFSQRELVDEIMRWYNGYSFDGHAKVINTLSLINFFQKFEFQEFFAQSGKLDFLVSSIIERGLSLKGGFDALYERKSSMELVSTDFNDSAAMLFQSGFLTIDVEDDAPRVIRSYKLKIPNLETKNCLNRKTKA